MGPCNPSNNVSDHFSLNSVVTDAKNKQASKQALLGGVKFYIQTDHPLGRYVDFIETVEVVQFNPDM